MPKLTNTCAICGKPILKSWTICDECREKINRQEQEIQIEIAKTRAKLLPEFLWEKRRAEYAGQAMAAILTGDVSCVQPPAEVAKRATEYADALVAELRNTQPQ